MSLLEPLETVEQSSQEEPQDLTPHEEEAVPLDRSPAQEQVEAGDSQKDSAVHLAQGSPLVPLEAPTGPPPPPILSKRGKVLKNKPTAAFLANSGNFKAKWDWEPVRQDRIKHGWSNAQLAEKYGIPEGTVQQRASREKWPSVTEVRKRNEMLATVGDRRATQEMFDQWVAKIRHDLNRNVEEILLEGPTQVSRLSMDEVKLKKEQLSLLQAYQNLILTHQTQGAKLRQLEREEYPAERDTGKVDMLAMIAFHRAYPHDSPSLQEVAIDCTSEAMARAREIDQLPPSKLPSTRELDELANATKQVFATR